MINFLTFHNMDLPVTNADNLLIIVGCFSSPKIIKNMEL
jgi:hypothetical protein